VHTRAFNQDGVLVAEFKRVVLVPRMTQGATLTRQRATWTDVAPRQACDEACGVGPG
jgi:hypothetical protein